MFGFLLPVTAQMFWKMRVAPVLEQARQNYMEEIRQWKLGNDHLLIADRDFEKARELQKHLIRCLEEAGHGLNVLKKKGSLHEN